MEQYIGLDVSMKETANSIQQDGKRIWRGKCASDPQLLAAVIRKRASRAQRVVFETGPWNRTVPQLNNGLIMDYGDGWAPTIYVDANLHYQLTPLLSVSLDAINLTRETEKQWAQRERRILLNRLDEGSTYLFGINFKI